MMILVNERLDEWYADNLLIQAAEMTRDRSSTDIMAATNWPMTVRRNPARVEVTPDSCHGVVARMGYLANVAPQDKNSFAAIHRSYDCEGHRLGKQVPGFHPPTAVH